MTKANGSSAIRRVQEKVDELRASKVDVIDLGMGRPDVAVPREYLTFHHELSGRILRGEAPSDAFNYTHRRGYPKLVEKVEEYEQKRHGWASGTRGNVIVTNGASQAISLFLSALPVDSFSDRDEVCVFAPQFCEYGKYIEGANLQMRAIPFRSEEESRLSEAKRAIGKKTAAVILNSPNNPTGEVYSPRFVRALADWALEKEAPMLFDDALDHKSLYHGQTPAASLLAYANLPLSASAYSASKVFGISGERVGWLTLHPRWPNLEEHMERLETEIAPHGIAQAPTFPQIVLSQCDLSSLGVDWSFHVRMMMYMAHSLRKKGYSVIEPHGGLFFTFESPTGNAEEFCKRLLSPGQGYTPVAAVPVDCAGGPDLVRLAYCRKESKSIGRNMKAIRTLGHVR